MSLVINMRPSEDRQLRKYNIIPHFFHNQKDQNSSGQTDGSARNCSKRESLYESPPLIQIPQAALLFFTSSIIAPFEVATFSRPIKRAVLAETLNGILVGI